MATRFLWSIAAGLALGLLALLAARWVGTMVVWIGLLGLLVLVYLRARRRG